MKVRTKFVSNSSSSSFTILLDRLTARQYNAIQNHIRYAKKYLNHSDLDTINESDAWNISHTEDRLYGRTGMDNFDMSWFLGAIGVYKEDICWDSENREWER